MRRVIECVDYSGLYSLDVGIGFRRRDFIFYYRREV